MTDGYILGSDGNGRDILTRLAYGGRVSIMIAVLSGLATFFPAAPSDSSQATPGARWTPP
ncbi:MAG: hypothetical protein R2853_16900 [Thermomicrobiales bacterium]